jgi:hypothetical protein
VYRELLDVRRLLRLHARGRDTHLNATLEEVAVGARLPEVDHAPASLDRARGVEDEAFRRIFLGVHVRVHSIEPLLGNSRELDADANGQSMTLLCDRALGRTSLARSA